MNFKSESESESEFELIRELQERKETIWNGKLDIGSAIYDIESILFSLKESKRSAELLCENIEKRIQQIKSARLK